MATALPFAAALLLLVLGHWLRAMRHLLLFPRKARPRSFHLMVGLSIAYVLHAVIPFRLGELARAFYVSARAEQGFGRVLATIIAERLSDLVLVAGLLLVLPLALPLHLPHAATLSLDLALFAGAIIAFAVALRVSRRVRRGFWRIASIFNNRLLLDLADCAWTTARLVTGTAMLQGRYLLLTLLMWAAYLLSYQLLAAALGLDLGTILVAMLGSPLQSLMAGPSALVRGVVQYASLAALFILVVGLLVDRSGASRSIGRVLQFGMPSFEPFEGVPSTVFVEQAEYGAVLRAHFTDSDPTIANFGLHGLEGCMVHRILPGGSDAVTAVVEVDGKFAIRKFAIGPAADRLEQQANWLGSASGQLPFAPLADQKRNGAKFHYDMPYFMTARDLYEVIHSAPAAVGRSVLGQVVEAVGAHHAAHRSNACSADAVAAYIDRKVIDNAREALRFARLRLPETYEINGESYALAEWDALLDRSWVDRQMPSRHMTAIHGDLTVENIIVCPKFGPGWYLIDPNPGNFFDSELIDWAKLMQSLNLGYEMLNRSTPARLREGAIEILFANSKAYAELHEHCRGLLAARYASDQLREIDFHEIVNYLRLIPYKIRSNPAKALTFFGAASILIRRYRDAAHA